jgi:nitrogen fixation-related uncharacterized protein
MTPADWYRTRDIEWTARHDVALRRGTLISRLRLAAFFIGVALLWWGLGSHRGSPHSAVIGLGFLAFFAFGLLVARHARTLEELDRSTAARRVNTYGLARLTRDWQVLPEVPPPAEVDIDLHPYVRDLDLFGHASLSKWLGRPATSGGAYRLWDWLLTCGDAAAIIERQVAVDELAAKREWREALAIEGQLTTVSDAELRRFLEWAETTAGAVPRVMDVLAILLPVSLGILLLLFLMGGTETAWWLIPLTVNVIVSFALAGRVYATFDRAALGQRALQRYAHMFRLVSDERWTAPLLQKVHDLLEEGGSAPSLVKKLADLTGWSELRTGAALLHFPIQAVTLWDFQVLFALERWRTRSGRHVRAWLDALGSADALAVLANVRADQPEWTTARVDPQIAVWTAIGLGHPLLPDDRRVTNDVAIGPPGTVLLITGSNMSGKSTLLRAIGLNGVLAQAGAPVCATSLAMPLVDLHTSIRVQDSLELGLSYFMAALARLKQIVDAAEQGARPGRALMYLLDEVLQGTNSVERAIAVRAVARHLLDARAIGAMTTHDLALADQQPLKSAATLVHFTEQVHPDGTMSFDYRLRPGLATSSNALRLMQLIGITPR